MRDREILAAAITVDLFTEKRRGQISKKEFDDALQACDDHYQLPSMSDRKILTNAVYTQTD
jgi:hypothetical protein